MTKQMRTQDSRPLWLTILETDPLCNCFFFLQNIGLTSRFVAVNIINNNNKLIIINNGLGDVLLNTFLHAFEIVANVPTITVVYKLVHSIAAILGR